MLKKINFFFYIVFLLVLSPMSILSQQGSDIYLIQITPDGAKLVFVNPVKINVTEGYNNQPFFHPDGESLFFASGVGSNTDIYQYTIETGRTIQLTDTPDSEYSPTVMPVGSKFSVIQLITSEGPREGAQPLIAFPIAGGQPELLYEDGERVGYHAWINSDTVAMFLLGTPNFLQIVNIKDRSSQRIAENIGRSLYKIPGQESISFSQSSEDSLNVIMRYNLKTGKSETIVPMLEGNSFYAWSPSGMLVMGVKSTLFGFRPGLDEEWQTIWDLNELGIKNISRLAVHPETLWIAVVSSQ
ncbi:TolB family protein [Acidobacteriota bacterium]